MKIGVLMQISNPWSREAVLRLAELGNEIHVIGMEVGTDHAYLRRPAEWSGEDLQQRSGNVKRVYLMRNKGSALWRYAALATALRRILNETNVECLLTLYGGGFGMMAWLSRFTPYAVYLVGSDVMQLNPMKRMITKRVLRSARRVFVNGTYLRKQAEERFSGVAMRSLYLGVETNRFVPGSKREAPLRIVCTRGFYDVYNNESIIKAVAGLPSDVPDFSMTFVSGGPLLEKAVKLADRILDPAIRNKVSFLGGVESDRLLSLVADSHIYVSMSRSDGTSTSLLEALSCSLFPVVSDIPQNREWICPDGSQRNGILVPLDDPQAAAEALRQAILNQQWRADAGQRNRELVIAKADSRSNMQNLVEDLQNMQKRN